MRRGIEEELPYSLSRWTDLPAAKWPWFKSQLDQGEMIAFDPRSAVPWHWSLRPEDTLGLVFWTKDPRSLLRDRDLLTPYRVKIHLTITGWEEVEKGAPSLDSALGLLGDTAGVFGAENVTWRFSPVPLLPAGQVVERFRRIGEAAAQAGVRKAYLSFLQPNDLLPETRAREERLELLLALAEMATAFKVHLCNEDRLLSHVSELPSNLSAGVCAPPEDWDLPGHGRPPSEGCGCALMVDPFTINESCTMGCQYCYAADKTLAPRKHNTTRGTRGLPVL